MSNQLAAAEWENLEWTWNPHGRWESTFIKLADTPGEGRINGWAFIEAEGGGARWNLYTTGSYPDVETRIVGTYNTLKAAQNGARLSLGMLVQEWTRCRC